MLDRKLIHSHLAELQADLERRHAPEDMRTGLNRLAAAITRRRELQGETDELRSQRNTLSKQIGPLMKAGDREAAEPLRAQVKTIGERLSLLEDERKNLEEEEENLLFSLPNLLQSEVPTGKTEDDNIELRTWGTQPEFDFDPLDHVTIGERLGILDFERASKLSGARFPVYLGAGARLERALINFFVDRATDQGGYTELIVPYIVSRSTMTGTGQLPKFEEDLFRLSAEVNGEDAYLIPTAEVPITNLHSGEILKESDLPKQYTAFTPCFRAEAGSYGRDVRGLMRQHQFHKVELVRLCTEEQGAAQLEALTADAESILQALGLHYRVELLCSGDTGFSANKTNDLEVWVPSQGRYREISSCSWFTDFQGRRMGMRYRPDEGGKPRTVHTINGSALAVGRTVIAILENYQQADGSVLIPEVLQPYMGGLARISPPQ